MVREENECCSCATAGYPCRGDDCPNRHVMHFYCDRCGDDTTLYEYAGEQLCLDCLLKEFEVVEGSNE